MRCIRDLYGHGKALAFTLIELLVVIAILALLMVLLFPTFASALRKAHQTMCLSNERQIGTAFHLYVTDYDEHWPTLGLGDTDWTKGIQPYIKGPTKALMCPDAVRSDRHVVSLPGYAINAKLLHSPNSLAGLSQSSILYAATTVSLCEAPWGYDNTFGPTFFRYGQIPDPMPEEAWKRHHGGADYLFCDGHAKWYLPDAVSYADAGTQNGTHPSFATDWSN